MDLHNRRVTDRNDVRLLIGTLIVCTFLVLGTLAFAIVNTNIRVDESIQTIENGVTCMLGNIAGREDIQRPDRDEARAACLLFLREQSDSPAEAVP